MRRCTQPRAPAAAPGAALTPASVGGRFDNEARRLRTFGGRLVRIRRQTDNHAAVLGHRSETESARLNSDHYLPNDGSITELHRRLNRLVDRLDKQRRPA